MGELEEELKKVKEEAEEAARNAAKAAGNEEDEVGGFFGFIWKQLKDLESGFLPEEGSLVICRSLFRRRHLLSRKFGVLAGKLIRYQLKLGVII